MAAIKRFADYALEVQGTSVPIEPGSLGVGNDAITDRIRSGQAMYDDLIQWVGKQPTLSATLLDPSVITDWTSALTSGVKACWRAFEENGGWSSSYKSIAYPKAVVYPVKLSGEQNTKATTEIEARGIFDAGSAATVGTASVSRPTVAAAYYPTSITIGGGAISALMSINVNWNWDVQNDEQTEPGYYYYPAAEQTGQAQIKDLDEITAARLVDSSEETVVALFTDANNNTNTVSVDLGTCKVNAEVSGDMATVNFEKIQS